MFGFRIIKSILSMERSGDQEVGEGIEGLKGSALWIDKWLPDNFSLILSKSFPGIHIHSPAVDTKRTTSTTAPLSRSASLCYANLLSCVWRVD